MSVNKMKKHKGRFTKEWHDENRGTRDYEEMLKNSQIKRKATMNKRIKGGRVYLSGCAKDSKENPKKYSGKNNPFYGKKHSKETLKMLEEKVYSKIRGKTFKESYGKEKANEIERLRKKAVIKFNSNKGNLIKRGKKISKTKRRLIKEGKLNPMKGNLNPSKPERLLGQIIKRNNLPFNHVGNGKIYFHGPNHSFNPDFLSKNPKHIIEVFGDYWHNLPGAKIKDKERLKTYSKYGYKTLVIWEHELVHRWNKQLTEPQIVNKIRGFLNDN